MCFYLIESGLSVSVFGGRLWCRILYLVLNTTGTEIHVLTILYTKLIRSLKVILTIMI